jgi:hypothetical protein
MAPDPGSLILPPDDPESADGALVRADVTLEQLAEAIGQAHDQCRAAFGKSLWHALECGHLLLEAKQKVPHGQWRPWLAGHCKKVTERQAQRYMQVARDLPEGLATDTTRVSDLSLRDALDFLSYSARLESWNPQLVDDALDRHERKPPRQQPEEPVLEELHKLRMEQWQRDRQRRKSAKKNRYRNQRAQETLQEQRQAEYPDPLPPPGEIRFCGMDAAALGIVLDELKRSGDWYHDLAEKLAQVYEPRLRQLAMEVVTAVLALRERLSYSRESLQHAVGALRELLQAGPVRGNEIAAWARTANVSHGLLFLAAKLVGVVVLEPPQAINEARFSLARTCLWFLKGDPRLEEYLQPDGKRIDLPDPYDEIGKEGTEREGRWQRRKRKKRDREKEQKRGEAEGE